MLQPEYAEQMAGIEMPGLLGEDLFVKAPGLIEAISLMKPYGVRQEPGNICLLFGLGPLHPFHAVAARKFPIADFATVNLCRRPLVPR